MQAVGSLTARPVPLSGGREQRLRVVGAQWVFVELNEVVALHIFCGDSILLGISLLDPRGLTCELENWQLKNFFKGV